jgi:hypothetical protein
MSNCIATILLLFIWAMPVLVWAQAPQTIGRAISVNGSAQARSDSGELRALSRRSEIFTGDSIITGPNSFVQVRLRDAAMIAFSENTEITFEEYSFDVTGQNSNRAVMRLVKGGFRTITGAISNASNGFYQLISTFANISVDDATYECAIQRALYCGAYAGEMTIANASGSLNLNPDSNGDYAEVNPGNAPTHLIQQPTFLGQIILAQGSNGQQNTGSSPNQSSPSANNPPFPISTPIIMVPIRTK